MSTSRYADTAYRTAARRRALANAGRKTVFTVGALAAVAAGVMLFRAIPGNTGLDAPIADAARSATVSPAIAAMIDGQIIADETLDIPTAVQDPGTVMVLWRDSGGWPTDGTAVVYAQHGDQLVAVRACPLPANDIYNAGKGDKHKISNAIDDATISVHCETEAEAAAAGHENPMLIVTGRSGGLLGTGIGQGETVTREFGIL